MINDNRSFYSPGKDCQIMNLSEIYLRVFGEKLDGIFIEIGAYDGDTVSNTAFLADMGWTGYYFEPIQEYAVYCQMRHIKNKVKVITTAVSDSNENIKLSIGGALTSARQDHVEMFNQLDYSKDHHNQEIREVYCLEINRALNMLSLTTCDLAVVDVEGLEPLIMNQWDFSILQPKMLIIETRDSDQRYPEIIRSEYRNMLKNLIIRGYSIINDDGENIILQYKSI